MIGDKLLTRKGWRVVAHSMLADRLSCLVEEKITSVPSVTIMTDSVADLPAHVAEQFGITVVPLVVRFGTDDYRDGLDLNPDQFYGKLRTGKILPVMSVPSPAIFADAYDKLAEKNEIVVITLTSKLGATYQVALQSIGLMKKQCHVEVVDSQWAVMAQRLPAKYPEVPIYLSRASPVIGTHTGTGPIVVSVFGNR